MPTVSNKRKGEAAHTNIINYITSDPFGDINQRRSTLCCKQTSCMENSPIGGIASQMWLRPLYRLVVVQNVQGTVRRSTTSALHKLQAKMSEQIKRQTKHVIIVIRHQLDNVNLPSSSLQTLAFGEKFNHSLDNTNLPSGLFSLTLGPDFKQGLDNTNLPRFVRIVHHRAKFDTVRQW